MTPFGISIFCDDIRHEVQNKLTLVGCYGPELRIYAKPPVALPKLGILVQTRFPTEEKLSAIQLKLYVPKRDEPIFVHEEIEEANEYTPNARNLSLPPMIEDDLQVATQRAFVYPIIVAPLILEAAGYIKVRMVYRSETFRLGSLRVLFDEQEPASPPTS